MFATPNINTMNNKVQYYFSLAMVGCLFFIFGLLSWVNSILIPYFKVACDLQSGVQTYLVTFAFYIAYLVMTIPASFLLAKVGYKKGAMIGLFIMAIGTMLFWPAALTRTYEMFLAALFVIGTSLSILQSVANPFVTIIGPHESAAKRISIMGMCNKLAGILAPLVFAALVIRPKDKEVMAAVADGTLTGTAKDAALDEMIRGVIPPYVVLSVFLVIFAVLFFKSPIKDINPNKDNNAEGPTDGRRSVLSYPYLVLGVLALFFHVGSQQISIATIVEYAKSIGYGIDAANVFPSYTLACILSGYLLGVIFIPRFISQQKALVVCTVTGLVLSALVLVLPLKASLWSLVLLGIPNSLIYAGIWPLATRSLGKWTTLGSAFLVMALCGSAIMPLLYGWMTDHMGLKESYWLLIPCFAFMIYYAMWGYKKEYWTKNK